MSDTCPSRARVLPILIILVLALLSAGCTGSIPGAPNTSPGATVPSPNSANPAGNTCSFDHLIGDADVHLSRGDSSYFATHTPVDFLKDLRARPHQPVMVLDVPEGWITARDAELLMQEIDSTEPAAPVVSPLSSYWPSNQTSTVGNEALFLLEGYRTGRYPPALCSLYYFKTDSTAARVWWNSSGGQRFVDEKEAVRLVQDTCPDLKQWPSDDWPVLSIRTEPVPDGWYIAFIREGSGVPIISARCYHVSHDRIVTPSGEVNRSIFVMTRDFSPKRCGCEDNLP